MKIKQEMKDYLEGLLTRAEVLSRFVKYINKEELYYLKDNHPEMFQSLLKRVEHYPELSDDKAWNDIIVLGYSSEDEARKEIIFDIRIGISFISSELKGL